ncbi:MAG: hypothetical protein WDN49_10775 [Acetobacteraceae bacterium]
MARLVISSVQSTETGGFTLQNYLIAYGNLRGWMALAIRCSTPPP